LETDMPRFKRASRARRHDYLRAPRVIFDAEPVEPVPDIKFAAPIERVSDRKRDRADTAEEGTAEQNTAVPMLGSSVSAAFFGTEPHHGDLLHRRHYFIPRRASWRWKTACSLRTRALINSRNSCSPTSLIARSESNQRRFRSLRSIHVLRRRSTSKAKTWTRQTTVEPSFNRFR
jgi:hypothetical protein